MTFYIKVGRRQSSISIQDQIVALWFIMHYPMKMNDGDYNTIFKEARNFVLPFVQKRVDRDKGLSIKGLSKLITQRMIQSIMDQKDAARYKKILNTVRRD